MMNRRFSKKHAQVAVRGAVLPVLLLCAVSFSSCKDKIGRAMLQAGANKTELQAVLDHFKGDPDTLKYASARFLIENMPDLYTYAAAEMERYDSAYAVMAQEPTQNKDSVFARFAPKVEWDKLAKVYDVEHVKADYLIQMIEDACAAWHRAPWSKTYDTSVFFEYVLPYRLLDEPLSQWRDSAKATHPFLMSDDVRSLRGYPIEAESATRSSCHLFGAESASGKLASLFCHPTDSATFHLQQPNTARKCLYLCYSTGQIHSQAEIILNGSTVGCLSLVPTFSLETFNSSRAQIDLTLPEGNNVLTIKYKQGQYAVDYIHLASVEPCKRGEIKDFSSDYYQLRNVGTGKCVSFDTLQSSLLSNVGLKREEAGDSSTFLRLDDVGYACWRIAAFKRDSIDLCLDALNYQPTPETPIVQWKYVGGNNQKWIFLPAGGGTYRIMSKDCGLFLEAATDSQGRDGMIQDCYKDSPAQLWQLSRQGKRQGRDSGLEVGSAIAEAFRIFDITSLFDWFYFKGKIPPSAASLLKWKTGECRDETNYVVLLARSMGIPAAIDFTPHWGNRSRSHTWSVLIPPRGKAVTFYMGAAPGDTTNLFHSYKKPKIFRRQFSHNRKMEADLANERSIPELFKTPCFIDVTPEYCPTSDIVRDVPTEWRKRNVLYICVFDNEQWIPVDYGLVSDGQVKFSKMGREIMYVTAACEQGKITPIGIPYYVTAEGFVKDVVAREDLPTTLIVNRKYPFMGKEDFFNFRMWGGHFQGANRKDFSDAVDLYTFEGMTNGNWYEVSVKSEKRFRFLRYIGPNGSFCNINEISFFDENGKELKGEIAGTDGVAGSEKEKVFDGNILTGFHAVKPDGGWVGMRLHSACRIGKIRFIPRNDGNCVEVGDEYELCYWSDGRWHSYEEKTAAADSLIFHHVPSGALYLLHDLTKGQEERIFTYEDGRQVWW